MTKVRAPWMMPSLPNWIVAALMPEWMPLPPASESAHALGALAKVNFKPEDVVVLTVSGRGDKDMDTYIKYKLRIEN